MNKIFNIHISILSAFILIYTIAINPDWFNHYFSFKNAIIPIFTSFYLMIVLVSIFFYKKPFFYSIIDIFFATRIIWNVVTNPEIISDDSMGIILQFSFLIIVLCLRQVMNWLPKDLQQKLIRYLFRIVYISGFVEVIWGASQYYNSNPELVHVIKTPIVGSIGSANGYAMFIVIAIIATWYDFVSTKSKILRTLLFTYFLASFIIIVLNGSRGAILVLLTSGLLFIYFYYKKKSIKTRIFKNFSNIINPKYFLGSGAILIIVTTIVLYNINAESSNGRIMAWKISLPMFLENPIKGIGYNNYSLEFLNYQSIFFEDSANERYEYKASNLKQAHSEYFQIFFETGIIGGALFLLFIFFVIKKNLSQFSLNDDSPININYILLLIILAVVLHSFIDMPLHINALALLFYVSIGVIKDEKTCNTINIRNKVLFFLLLLSLLWHLQNIQRYVRQDIMYTQWKKAQFLSQTYAFARSLDYYKSAIAQDINNGELYFHYGSSQVFAKDYYNGINNLLKASESFNDRNLWLSLSFAYYNVGSYEDAKFFADKALKMFPQHLAPHLILAKIYLKTSDIEKAKIHLKKCINRETYIQSDEIRKIASEARDIWQNNFGSF